MEKTPLTSSFRGPQICWLLHRVLPQAPCRKLEPLSSPYRTPSSNRRESQCWLWGAQEMHGDVRCARQTQNSRQPQLAFRRTVASPLIRIYLLPQHRQGRLGLCQCARSDLESHLLWRKSARPASVYMWLPAHPLSNIFVIRWTRKNVIGQSPVKRDGICFL